MKTTERKRSKRDTADLPESKEDKKHLQPEETILDLPDVKDIPGQEHVRPMPPGEMADTTISSADEEADNLFKDDEDILEDVATNVSDVEKELLIRGSQSMGTNDDVRLQQAKLDEADEEGEKLNEGVDQSGKDLDVPGAEEDDANEEIGEEDEENNPFSLNDDKEDDVNTRQ